MRARAVGPWVGEQKLLDKTPLRGNRSPESTYLPTSQWTGDEEEKIVRAVKAAEIKSKGSNEEHLQAYGSSCDPYQRVAQALDMEIPLTDVFASQGVPKFQKCARYWHKEDSAWDEYWGAQRWGNLSVHTAQQDSERIVHKIIADRAKGVLELSGLASGDAHGEVLRSKIDVIALNELRVCPR